MEQEIYIVDYIDQMNKLIYIYNTIDSLINKINYFNYRKPTYWIPKDVFEVIDYIKDNISNKEILDVINKQLDDLCNNLIIVKLEEAKNKYKECNDLFGADNIYIKDIDKEINLSDIQWDIDYIIKSNNFDIILRSREYVKYTDDEIKIIKNYILKIIDELSNFKNTLKLDINMKG